MSLDLGALLAHVGIDDIQFQRSYVRLVRQFADLGVKAGAASTGTDALDASLTQTAAAGNAAASGLGRAEQAMTGAGLSASEATAATRGLNVATSESAASQSKLTQAVLRGQAAEQRLADTQAAAAATARHLAAAEADLAELQATEGVAAGKLVAAQERVNMLRARATALTGRLASSEASLAAASDRVAVAQERAATATSVSSSAWQGFGRKLLLVGGLVAAGFAVAGHEAAQFDAQMANIRALAQHATSGEMSALRQAALTVGQAYGYAADQAADAEAELIKAGVGVRAILGGALTGALTLAAAGQENVADATSTAAVAMTQFHLAGKDVPHIADLLAAGADKALGSVHDLSEALTYGGLAASQAGFSIEETVGVLAELAQNGQIGSVAGAQLAMMLRNLQKPSDQAAELMDQLGIVVYDSSGQMLSAAQIAGELHDKIGGLPPAQRDAALATLFTSRAVRAANILMREGADATQGWIDKVNDQGFAAQQASGKLDSLTGDVTKLRAALSQALIGTGEDAQGPLREVVQDLTKVIEMWNALPGPVRHAAEAFIAVGAGVAILGGAFLVLVPKINAARTAMVEMNLTAATVRGGLARTAGFMAGPWGLAITAGVTALSFWAAKSAAARERTDELTQAIEADSGALGENTRAAVANRLEKDGALAAAQKLGIGLDLVTDAALGNKAALDQVTDGLIAASQAHRLDSAAATTLVISLGKEKDATSDAMAAAKRHAKAVGDDGDAATGAAPKVGALGDSIGAAARQTKTATDRAKDYADTLHALADPLFAMNKALADLREKQKAATEAVKKHGAESKAARQAQLDLASSSLDVEAAASALAASVDDGTTSLSQSKRMLRDWVRDGLITKAQADAVRDSFAGIIDKADELSRTHPHLRVTADVGQATSALNRVREYLSFIHDKTIDVTVRELRVQQGPGGVLRQTLPMASGGPVIGPGTGTSDDIDARLSNGEFVVRADGSNLGDAVRYYGNKGAGVGRPIFITVQAGPFADQIVAKVPRSIREAAYVDGVAW